MSLTKDVGEIVNGTDGDDTFSAITGTDSDKDTLNVGDQVDGRGGNDTMDIYVQGDASNGMPAGATVRNVETINLHQTSGKMFAGTSTIEGDIVNNAIDASVFQGAKAIWQIDAAADVAKLGAGQTAGFRGDVGVDQLTVGYGKAVTEASIALDGVTDEFDVLVQGAGLKSVSVSGSVKDADADDEAPAVLNLDIEGAGGAKGIGTIDLALTSDTLINIGNGFSSKSNRCQRFNRGNLG